MGDVLLFSRNDVFSDALVAMLTSEGFAKVTTINSESTECLSEITSDDFSLVLINAKSLEYPLESFFRKFIDWNSKAKILVFGHDSNTVFVRNLIRSGAHGFINDETTDIVLKRAISSLNNGNLWVSRELLDKIAMDAFEVERMIESAIRERISLLGEQLSGRELDVFKLLLDGLSTKEIASHLCLSEQSVKLYLNRLFRKFEVKNRAQLILIAFEKVCPVQNIIKLFRTTLDQQRIRAGKAPIIADPLGN